MSDRIGFIGLGNMGAPMAAKLAEALGLSTRLCDVTSEVLNASTPPRAGEHDVWHVVEHCECLTGTKIK